MGVPITVEVGAEVLGDALQTAIRDAFSYRFSEAGAGLSVIKAQADQWARGMDYTPIIQELAPDIIRDAVTRTLEELIKVEVKRQIKALLATGETISPSLLGEDVLAFIKAEVKRQVRALSANDKSVVLSLFGEGGDA